MSLLDQIKDIEPEAARILEEKDFSTDSDIQLLNENDLRDLFPGADHIKLRKKIMWVIPPQNPIDAIKNIVDVVCPPKRLTPGPPGDDVFFEHHVAVLKKIKIGVNELLDAHINLQIWNGKMESEEGSSFIVLKNEDFMDCPEPTVKYHLHCSGKTLGAHNKLMKEVKDSFPGALVESNQDHQVTILVCPIVTRIGTDVEDALVDIEDDKPVILVLMHHKPEPSPISTVGKVSSQHKIVMKVNVFFHETKNGMLSCHQNNDAVSKIQRSLQEFIPETSKDKSTFDEDKSGCSGINFPLEGGGNGGMGSDPSKNKPRFPSVGFKI